MTEPTDEETTEVVVTPPRNGYDVVVALITGVVFVLMTLLICAACVAIKSGQGTLL